MNQVPRRLIINMLYLVMQHGLFCLLICPILRANISHFTAQYHPYCTPIWPILQRGLYVTANQLLRNPFSKVLPQSHSPLLWRGRGRLPLFAFPPFGRVRVGTLCSFSLPLGGAGWVSGGVGVGIWRVRVGIWRAEMSVFEDRDGFFGEWKLQPSHHFLKHIASLFHVV